MVFSADLKLKEREAAEGFLASGSEESFRVLFEALYSKLIRYFVVRGLEPHVAEELAQDVLMTTYQHAESLRQKECFFGWLFKIAGNRHLQYLRQCKRKIETIGLTTNAVRSLKRCETSEIERQSDFVRWMGMLEPVERQIMMLRYFEELGYQEIATALRLPLGTVKWRVFTAKERLSAELGVRADPQRSIHKAYPPQVTA
jgi:RNA polymerase sigma-70 factor (ECF subfamily)